MNFFCEKVKCRHILRQFNEVSTNCGFTVGNNCPFFRRISAIYGGKRRKISNFDAWVNLRHPRFYPVLRGKYFLFRLFGINCKYYIQCPKFHDWLHLNTKTLYPGNHDSYDIFSVIIFLIIIDDETIFRKSFVISSYLWFFFVKSIL